MDLQTKIVKKMVSIFKKMDTDAYINAHFLCRMAVESLGMPYDWREYEECWSFYYAFHDERRKQKIRIKRIKHHGEDIGIPPNCDYFARCGEKTKRQKDYEAALKRYKRKFGELPYLDNGVHGMMLKSRVEITRILNQAVEKGIKARNESFYKLSK